MRLKSTPCEGAAVDQGIKRSPEPLVTWAPVATGNRQGAIASGSSFPVSGERIRSEWRGAPPPLRFYDHWCPDVSRVIKLARFPVGHPNASV